MEPTTHMALRAARRAGKLIVKASERLDRIAIEAKGLNDFVTDVDRTAEREILQQLCKTYPHHTFLGEEGGLSGEPDSEFRWFIDPLDGTTNFIHGLPHFAVSIACEHRGSLEHAVVLDPIRGEEFTASRGRGAYLNGRRIRVSSRDSLFNALLGTGLPFRQSNPDHLAAQLDTVAALGTQGAVVRTMGSAALDLAYVAAGRLDAFWHTGLASWDIAAGALLIQEAGGLIADLDGGSGFLDRGQVVCGNPKCFKAVLQAAHARLGAPATEAFRG